MNLNKNVLKKSNPLKKLPLIVFHSLLLSCVSMAPDVALAMQGDSAITGHSEDSPAQDTANEPPSSRHTKSIEPSSSESSIDGRVVVSGKQSFENQLLMREMFLLRTNPALKVHLSISDVQAVHLQEVERVYQRRIGDLGRASLKITERAQKIRSLFADIEKTLTDELSHDQRKRLRQVAIQSFGSVPGKDDLLPVFNLLANADFRSYLDIDSVSAEPLQRKLREEYLKLQRDIAELKKRSNEAVLNSLSNAENARLKEMLGEPFPFDKNPDTKNGEKSAEK